MEQEVWPSHGGEGETGLKFSGSAMGEVAPLSGQEWGCTVQRGWPASVEVGAPPGMLQSAPELTPSLGPPLFQGVSG